MSVPATRAPALPAAGASTASPSCASPSAQKIWRRLRGRSAFAHIAALIRAILDRDALARQVAARLARGLTRLNPLVLVHARAEDLAVPAPRAASALDSS